MNCQELAAILDEQHMPQLASPQRGAVELHLSACPACAREYELQQRVNALPIPPLAPATISAWRSLALAEHRSPQVQTRSVLIAGVVALAAAAALLLVLRIGEIPEQAVLRVPESIENEGTGVAASPGTQTGPEEAAAEGPGPTKRAAQPVVPSFRVFIQPLQYETENEIVRSLVGDYYNAFLVALRAVPGLLLEGPAPVDLQNVSNAFVVTITAREGASRQAGELRWQVMIRVLDASQPPRRVVQPTLFLPGSDCVPGATPDTGKNGCDIAAHASDMVQNLRMTTFPVDPALATEVYRRIADPSRSVEKRRASLQELVTLKRRLPTVLDHPGLLDAVIGLARQPQSERLRAEAVTRLAADFADDAAARAALEAIAVDDTSPLVRNLAGRAVNGEWAWRQYVHTTLANELLPPAERLAPLTWMYDSGAQQEADAMLSGMLERGGSGALAELLSDPDPDEERERLRRRIQGLAANHPDASVREAAAAILRR